MAEWLSHSASDHQGGNKQDQYLIEKLAQDETIRLVTKIDESNLSRFFWRRPDYLWHQ